MSVWQKIKNHLFHTNKLLWINNHTYEQNFTSVLTNLKLYLILFVLGGIVTFFTGLLIFFTPIRNFIPGYTDPASVEKQNRLIKELSEMKTKVERQDSFITSIQRMSGYVKPDSLKVIEDQDVPKILPKNYIDKLNEKMLESPLEKTSFGKIASKSVNMSDALVNLIPPINGYLTNSFNEIESHLGIDLAAKENELVKAVASGYVLFSEFSVNNGFVTAIQHKNGMISFYKHNSKLFKQSGSYVQAGEAIAIVGNSGENSTGPHLHFELWIDGHPTNPLDFLSYSE